VGTQDFCQPPFALKHSSIPIASGRCAVVRRISLPTEGQIVEEPAVSITRSPAREPVRPAQHSASGYAEALLRLPLLFKILIANSVIVAIGAVAGTVITVWHVINFPDESHYELIAFFSTVGLSISFAVNYFVLRIALTPLDRLQSGVDRVQSGKLDVRVDPGPLSDERFDRLISTFNQMLDRLAQDAQQLHRLPGAILQAQEEERHRVARELHDEAAQALTSLLVRLRLLERSETPEDARKHVHQLRALTAAALEEVRRVALELRPTILDDLGLEAAIAWRVDELNSMGGSVATLKVEGLEERLPRDIELVLYRVAQEALSNIARHASAQHASVLLARRGDSISLEVSDDGSGFDLRTAEGVIPSGLGLPGIRERLALVGGNLSIDTRPGHGTRIVARLQVSVPAPGEAPLTRRPHA
jgi:two-component system, NarL family, sensor histidine kinase UhpB